MADSAIAITAGSGTSVDTRTETTNGNHRQVVVLGDPATTDGVAPVDATNGLAVDVKALPATAATAAKQDTVIGHLDGVEGLLTTIDADTGGILTAVQLLDDAISGNEMQVDIVAALPAGTARIGVVGASDDYFEITPTLGTVAYGSGSVLFPATQIANVPVSSGRPVVLQSIVVVDKDDQGYAMDLHFFDRSVTFGTALGVPAISDSDAAFSMGWVNVGTADYKDLGGVRVATVRGVGLEMKPNATDLYIAGVTGGTPTHSANGLVVKMGFLRS